MEIYKAFSKELADSLNPETPMEQQLAQTVADTQWRLNRARTYEDGILALGHGQALSPQYGGEIDASGQADSPEIHSALTAARVFRDNSTAFVNLSLYEQRLSRAQKEAFRQLRELQAERKAAPPKVLEEVRPPVRPYPLNTVTQTMAAGQANTMPAVASEENGFVYSNAKNDPCTLEIRALFPNQTGFDYQPTSTPTHEKEAA